MKNKSKTKNHSIFSNILFFVKLLFKISPSLVIGELCWGERDYKVNDNKIGALSQKLYDELTGIQWGTKPDPFGWTCRV